MKNELKAKILERFLQLTPKERESVLTLARNKELLHKSAQLTAEDKTKFYESLINS